MPVPGPDFIDLRLFRMARNFRGRSAFMVQLWWLVQDWLVRPSPQFMYGWRRFWWRLFGAQLGAAVLIRPSARATFPWKISIGARSWIGDRVELYSLGSITIGADAVISQDCYLCAGGHDYTRLDFPLTAQAIHIEDQVWLAAGCFIAPGIRVGRGAIIGARSVVLADMPAAMISSGHPARVLKPRPQPVAPKPAASAKCLS